MERHESGPAFGAIGLYILRQGKGTGGHEQQFKGRQATRERSSANIMGGKHRGGVILEVKELDPPHRCNRRVQRVTIASLH